MDRQSIIKKIKAAIALKENTNFATESLAASKIIEKLCKEYNIGLDELGVQVTDETFASFGRMNSEKFMILSYVSEFYDAKCYKLRKSFKVIGTEAQQIQTKVYYDFIIECMEREVNIAYSAEKILSGISGRHLSRKFKNEFRQSFAVTVGNRLREMKEKEHEHAEYTRKEVEKMNFRTLKTKISVGAGTIAGCISGNSVSLNKQLS